MNASQRCSQCGRVIGAHLGYTAAPGRSQQICYRCQRRRRDGSLPTSLQSAWDGEPSGVSQRWLFRLGAAIMVALTATIVWQTRNVGHTLIGFAGMLLFLALGRRAVHQRNQTSASSAEDREPH